MNTRRVKLKFWLTVIDIHDRLNKNLGWFKGYWQPSTKHNRESVCEGLVDWDYDEYLQERFTTFTLPDNLHLVNDEIIITYTTTDGTHNVPISVDWVGEEWGDVLRGLKD